MSLNLNKNILRIRIFAQWLHIWLAFQIFRAEIPWRTIKTIQRYSADIIDIMRILNNLADTIIYHEEVVACIK